MDLDEVLDCLRRAAQYHIAAQVQEEDARTNRERARKDYKNAAAAYRGLSLVGQNKYDATLKALQKEYDFNPRAYSH